MTLLAYIQSLINDPAVLNVYEKCLSMFDFFYASRTFYPKELAQIL